MTSEEHRTLDDLTREQLDRPNRELAEVLDEWMWRLHGTMSSAHGVGLFLDLLADKGYSVVGP